jgi:hypothetical protein
MAPCNWHSFSPRTRVLTEAESLLIISNSESAPLWKMNANWRVQLRLQRTANRNLSTFAALLAVLGHLFKVCPNGAHFSRQANAVPLQRLQFGLNMLYSFRDGLQVECDSDKGELALLIATPHRSQGGHSHNAMTPCRILDPSIPSTNGD